MRRVSFGRPDLSREHAFYVYLSCFMERVRERPLSLARVAGRGGWELPAAAIDRKSQQGPSLSRHRDRALAASGGSALLRTRTVRPVREREKEMEPVWEWRRRTCSSTVPDSSQSRHGEVRPLAVLVDDVRGVLVPLTHGGPQEKGTTTRWPTESVSPPAPQEGWPRQKSCRSRLDKLEKAAGLGRADGAHVQPALGLVRWGDGRDTSAALVGIPADGQNWRLWRLRSYAGSAA